MNEGIAKRIIFNAIVVVTLFITPWWVPALLLFVGLGVFESYIEFIIFALLLDALYGSFVMGNRFLLTIISLIVYTSFIYLKKRLKFY